MGEGRFILKVEVRSPFAFGKKERGLVPSGSKAGGPLIKLFSKVAKSFERSLPKNKDPLEGENN